MHFGHLGVALLPPVAFILWIILMDWWKPIAGVKELDLLSDPELRAAGIVKALLPPELGLFRLTPPHRGTRARAHHPPDFQLWLQHVPAHCRVIILAMSPWTFFNENAALGLSEVASQLRSQDRELIVCGITSHQYKVLARHGVMDVMNGENFCPDLEFAIARGIELVRHRNAPVRASDAELGLAIASA